MSYVPWAVVLGPPLATIAIYAAFQTSRRARIALLVTTATVISAVGLFLVILIEHRQTIMVGLNTVYPGDRKAGAQFTSWLQLFGSPLLYGDQFTQQFKLNQSEASSSFLICGVVAIALLLFKGRVKVLGKLVVPIAILAVTVVLWTLWSSINLTVLTRNLPIINRVPAVRAAQVVGILGILLMVFTLQAVSHRLRPIHRFAVALLSFASVIGAAMSANLFPNESLSVVAVAVPAAICGLLMLVITAKNLRYVQVAVCLALTSVLVARINPIQIGLADLRDGTAAGQVRDLSGINAGRHEVWASDSFQIDALIIASRPLVETCLVQVGVIAWAGGSSQYVYRILKEYSSGNQTIQCPNCNRHSMPLYGKSCDRQLDCM